MEEVLNMILYGTQELFRVSLADGTLLASFPGAAARLKDGEQEEDEPHGKKTLKERFIEEIPCPECGGTRLKKEALYSSIANSARSALKTGKRSARVP